MRPVHLLGHSWGGWLAIEYALAHPRALKSLILEDTVADMPASIAELERLRGALGPETVGMLQRHKLRDARGPCARRGPRLRRRAVVVLLIAFARAHEHARD